MKLHLFEKWARKGDEIPNTDSLHNAVIYTRVSSKEQAEKNLSLDFQMRAIRTFAQRNQFTIEDCFGGTFESAKTDGRKEFRRMLEYVAANKGRVSHILVYTLDRFSRTGGAAIKLCDDLRNEYGVSVLAVTQPTDNSNPSGIFQQNIQLLFSEFDNQLRRQRAMAGMREKFERGIWCIRPPMGYTIIREHGQRKIIVNKEGELLRNAFEWKAKGMKNQVILEKLQLMGLDIYKQKLSAILSNPFYAGIVSTKMLNGRLVEGTHEKLIQPELFLKIHREKPARKVYSTAKKSEHAELPLKTFVRCAECGEPLTGYGVHKDGKSFYYYKCRTQGCRCNANAGKLNDRFALLLQSLAIPDEYKAGLQRLLKKSREQLVEEKGKELEQYVRRLESVNGRMEKLLEQYHVTKTIEIAVFEKLQNKYSKEKSDLEKAIAACSILTDSSSQEESFSYLMNSPEACWLKAPLPLRMRLQQLIFPQGVTYSKASGFSYPLLSPLFIPISDTSQSIITR